MNLLYVAVTHWGHSDPHRHMIYVKNIACYLIKVLSNVTECTDYVKDYIVFALKQFTANNFLQI